MRRLWAFPLVLFIQSAAPIGTATVEGIVLRNGTINPVEGASVSLVPEGKGPNAARGTSTDQSGSFKIAGVPPGRYQLNADRSGFRKIKQNGGPTTLSLSEGQHLTGVRVQLTQLLAIAGLVSDDRGAPIASATVTAIRLSYNGGQPVLFPCAAPANARVATDERGGYRLYGLEPGDYYLAIARKGAQVLTQNGILPSAECSTWYYPDVDDPADAVLVTLRPGADANGVNFRLSFQMLHTARFEIVPTRKASRAVPPRVSIVRLSRKGFRTVEYWGNAGTFANGIYTTPGLSRGSYELTYDYNTLVSTSQDNARVQFDIADRDVDGGKLVLQEAATIAGRIKTEGVIPDGWKVADLTIGLLPMDENAQSIYPIGYPVAADGTFQMGLKSGEGNVAVGRYRFLLTGLREDLYLATATIGDRDLLNSGVVVTGSPSGSAELTIRTGSRLDGIVHSTPKDEPVPDSVVALIPDQNRRGNLLLFKSMVTDQEGRFSIRGIAPGDYTLLAWEDADPGATLNEDFLRAFETRGVRISINRAVPATATVRVIPATK